MKIFWKNWHPVINMLGGLTATYLAGYYVIAPAMEAAAMAMPIEWFI